MPLPPQIKRKREYPEYLILERKSMVDLQADVRERLAYGYQLAGGVSVYKKGWFGRVVYVQALFKLF